jgi:hypothetical protein
VLRFALHRPGHHCQHCHVFTRSRAMACRSSTLVLPSCAGLGYRPARPNVSSSADGREDLLPALNDRVPSGEKSYEC